MKINRIRVQNYKGFADSGWIDVADGINVVVGANNSGKSAFLECFRIGRLETRSHRTPDRGAAQTNSQPSFVQFELSLAGGDMLDFALQRLPAVAFEVDTNDQQAAEGFFRRLRDATVRPHVRMQSQMAEAQSMIAPAHGLFSADARVNRVITAKPTADRTQFEQFILQKQNAQGAVDQTVALAWGMAMESVYVFDTERYRIGKCPAGNDTALAPNASNLPVMINGIKNPRKLEELKTWLRRIFPGVKDLSASTRGNDVEINIFVHDTEREDLAIPLNDCGSGLAQVIAILFVVVTYSSAVIVIDEPNSFLHPGATKKLMDVLRQFPQHQFVVSTHSAEVISALAPDQVLMVTWDSNAHQSRVSPTDSKSYEGLRAVLGNIGASLSDVFGSEAVIWVEGPTEETCFPLLVEAHPRFVMTGAKFVRMREASAFGSKRRDLQELFDIYEKGVSASALLPPDVTFSFDRETSTEQQRADLERASKGKARFLPRRMFENYLIHPRAISVLLEQEDQGATHPISEVESWLAANLPKYAAGETDGELVKFCDAAKLLQACFSELTDSRVHYDKIKHGRALTRWLLAEDRSFLGEIIDYVAEVVPEKWRVSR